MAACTPRANAGGNEENLDAITSQLKNEQFEILTSRVGQKRSKGRPSHKDKINVAVTNQLLLQLHLIRQETGCQLSALQALFDELCTNRGVPPHNLGHLIQTCLYQLQSVKDGDATSFLQKTIELEWLGEYTKRHSITKERLLSSGCHEKLYAPTLDFISNGLLAELNIFRTRKGFSSRTLLVWLQSLCSQFDRVSTVQLNQLVNKVSANIKGLQKRKGEANATQRLQDFKDSPCLKLSTTCQTSSAGNEVATSSAAHSSTEASPPQSGGNVSKAAPHTPLTSPSGTENVSKAPSANALVPKDFEFQFHIARSQLKALNEMLSDQQKSVSSLQAQVQQLQKKNTEFKAQLEQSRRSETAMKVRVQEEKRKCVQLTRSNLNRRYERLRKKHVETTAQLRQLPVLTAEVAHEKLQKRLYQKKASRTEVKKRKLAEELESAESVIATLLNEGVHTAVPETRTDSGFFKDFVVKCIYQLVGECEVPAGRCRDVIKTVSKHFFGINFEDHQLPGKTSSLRFADQSQSLARMQVAEAVANQHFDLHADGTTKRQKKYVGMQVTLEDKQTLSLGFDSVAHETAQTVLNLALDKIQEFSELNECEDPEAEKKKILQNLVGVMTDRANTMKCFGRLLDDHRKTSLPDHAVQVEYLHCNAHFLLALSAASEKALLQVTTENNLEGNLGRDKLAVFNSNLRSGSAGSRYVWTGCDTLGPRADERTGCHGDWLAYCASNKRTSHISSFRANRFNNLFESAAGLVYHREDILQFFELKEPTNLKQKFVVADAECDILNVMVLGLALMYIFITGPFWAFVRSDVHYLDQYTFIQPMHSILKEMCQHPDMLLSDEEIPHELHAVRLRNNPVAEVVLQRRGALTQEQKNLLVQTLKALAGEFVTVVERQLADFLPEGRYGTPPTDDKRARMAHCRLTNLVGEACFADMDYSMFKNRRATLHHHATLNMVKRNATISKWLHTKTEEEQAALILKARKLGPRMRKESRQQELIVLRDLHTTMERKKREIQEAQRRQEEKLRQRKGAIVQTVNSHGGPCKTPEDVVVILNKFRTKLEKQKAMKAQVDYEKIVLGSSSAYLKTTKTSLVDMALNFIRYKFGDVTEELASAVGRACTRQKRRRQSIESSSSEDDGPLSADEREEPVQRTEETEVLEEDFCFSFSHQGQTVAVFYDRSFYVGQVLKVHNKDLAEVTFMTSKGNTNVFKWPQAEDLDSVASKFVFDSDFEIMLKNRTWHVECNRWKLLMSRWASFQKMFVH